MDLDTRIKLASALAKRAQAKSEFEDNAYRLMTKTAFVSELREIDPGMEKLSAWYHRVGNFLKDNAVDIGLTGMMLIPGLNVVGGLARAAHLGYKGYRAARAIQAARRGQQALSAARNVARSAKQIPRAIRQGANAFKNAPMNPLNRKQSLFMGSRGTTWTGAIRKPLADNANRFARANSRVQNFLRGPAQQAGRVSANRAGGGAANAWRNLSGGQKALRGAFVAAGAAELPGAAYKGYNLIGGAADAAAGRGQYASSGPNRSRTLSKMQVVQGRGGAQNNAWRRGMA